MAETADEPEIATMGKRGQVVIPKRFREQLGLSERSRFVVYGQGDVIVLKRLDLPDLEEEWDEVFRVIDEKDLEISEEEIREEIQAERAERRTEESG
jgi:AbrB family looped-hinge helix DNA binding protein